MIDTAVKAMIIESVRYHLHVTFWNLLDWKITATPTLLLAEHRDLTTRVTMNTFNKDQTIALLSEKSNPERSWSEEELKVFNAIMQLWGDPEVMHDHRKLKDCDCGGPKHGFPHSIWCQAVEENWK